MKKKKVNFAIIAILALILLLITGFTFSRLNQTHRGRVSMIPAKWFFNVTTNNGAAITDIVLTPSDGGALLPGTSGSFEINVDATGSAMPISYHTLVKEENFPDSMSFFIQGRPETKRFNMDEVLQTHLKGTLSAEEGQTKSYTICWEWPLENDDIIHNSTDRNYGFNFEVIGEQI